MPRGGARRGAGRPVGSTVSDRTGFLHIRATDDELERWQLGAFEAGLDLSNWVRRVLDGETVV